MGDWREWTGRGPHWPVHDEDGEIRVWPEWWSFEWEKYDGSWIMDELSANEEDELALARCVLRVMSVRLAANAIRRDIRSEDLHEEIAEMLEYVDELPCSLDERNAARRLLSALVPFDPEAISHALLHLTWNACAEGLDATARSLAQLAYEAAASNARYSTAHGAALALSPLARLQECPRVARKWRSIAYMQSRRFQRQRALLETGN